MKVCDMLKNVAYEKVIGDENFDVSDIAEMSKFCVEGSAFFAFRGISADGLDYVDDAVSRGAKVIFCDRECSNLPKSITQVVVPNLRFKIGEIAGNFFDHPAQKMKIIGVTGTNGKTTTTYMLKRIFEYAQHNVGVIGTNGVLFSDKFIPAKLTTPDPIDLHRFFFEMQRNGVDVVCMEMSAHALELGKIQGVMSDIAIFTNLTQDHLDFFGSMEKYGKSKAKLFSKELAKSAVVCIDNEFGKQIFEKREIPMLSYGFESSSDLRIMGLKTTNYGQDFYIKTKNHFQELSIPIFGKFNAQNAMAAISAANISGIDIIDCLSALKTMPPVAGRFNHVDLNEHGVAIIDYAHTPDGIENVLKAARELANNRHGRLISVFGCGGNRDKGKRPKMGRLSELYADFTIVTSDNPRLENPDEIVSEIVSGMHLNSHISITDRTEAIKFAIGLLGINDVVVVSGKGAEDYIDIGGQKLPYSDYDTIEKMLEEVSGEIE